MGKSLREKTGKPGLWLRLLINEFHNFISYNGTLEGFPATGTLKMLFPYCQGKTELPVTFLGWRRYGSLEFSIKPRLVSNLW